MKQIVTVTEVDGEGLDSLLGQCVLLMCANYFYTGKLVGVNKEFVKLEDPAIVYETGKWSDKGYVNAEKLHTKTFYIRVAMIESFGVAK